MIEVEFDDRVICIDKVSLSKLQAVWRGAVTRKHLAGLQQDYLELVKDIEQNDDLQVDWKYGPLCAPMCKSKKKLRSAEECVKRKKQQNTEQQQVKQTKPTEPSDTLNSAKDAAVQHTEICDEINQSEQVRKESGADIPERLTELSDNVVKQTDQVSDTSDDNRTVPGNDGNVVQHNIESEREMKETVDTPEQPGSWLSNGKDEEGEDEFIKMLDARKHEVSEEDLEAARGHIAMELLWVQQAISSRKQYLRLRDQMVEAIPES